VLLTPDDQVGALHVNAGCDFNAVIEPGACCSILEPGVCMMPVSQPRLVPSECAQHVLLDMVSCE
jgi:hypothetical protein